VLKPETFDDLGELEFLDLHDNMIKILESEVFNGLVKLTCLDLSQNELSRIELGVCWPMKKSLKRLNLR
jgi:Leucine-rich repeat (LRR) protein